MYLSRALFFSSLLLPTLASPYQPQLEGRSDSVTFPIKKRASHASNDANARSFDEIIARRLGRRTGRLIDKRATSETIAISNFEGNYFYYATMQIGTPPQSIDVLLDTSVGGIYVAAASCATCNKTLLQPGFDHSQDSFDTSRSSTYHNTTVQSSVTYGNGSISGQISTDTISLGSFTVQNQTFIAVEIDQVEFDAAGLMGFGFPASNSGNSTPWWLNALDQFASPEFSFYLADWSSSLTDNIAPGGQFTLGGRNSSLYDGNPTFVNVISQDYWTVPINSIAVTSNTTLNLSGSNATAIIDVGSPYIYGPSDTVDAFFQAVPGSIRGETVNSTFQGAWLVPCDTSVNAQFKFGAATVTMPAAALTLPGPSITKAGSSTEYCVGGMIGTPVFPDEPAWTFGISFLTSTYTIFRKGNQGDTPSIGFAPLKNVNYSGNGTPTLGLGGDGINGQIGNAGPTAAVITMSASSSSSSGGHGNGAAGLKIAGTSVFIGAAAVLGMLFV